MQSILYEMKSRENKLHWIYNISWGIAFGIGGCAGTPDFSFRYISIFIIASMLCTVGERLVIKLWLR